MVAGRLSGEWAARLLLILLVAGLGLAIVVARQKAAAVEVHAVMPEAGSWLPDSLSAEAGVPLKLRLTSDDVVHGFAVGQQDWPAVDVMPGQTTDLTLVFAEPGSYTYYCTRWCGPNHWRMRGTIEVTGEASDTTIERAAPQPLYVTLGLDIDAPHAADVQPARPPSAKGGAAYAGALPATYRSGDAYLRQSPSAVWRALQAEPEMAGLGETELWDLVAYLWQSQTTPDDLRLGQRLYGENCAACHGQSGEGNGVMATATETNPVGEGAGDAGAFGSALATPADFTDSGQMLGASSALLQGKIMRGGMGTGMPYYGTIFTDDEIATLVGYLWTFQFPVDSDT